MSAMSAVAVAGVAGAQTSYPPSARRADPTVALRAMQLSAAQVQEMADVRSRYAQPLQAYVDRLNALSQVPGSASQRQAVMDSVRALTAAERSALDSITTDQQRQRFDSTMRALRLSATVPAVRHARRDAASVSTTRP